MYNLFENEAERLAHPQACFIPRPILKEVFINLLSDKQLELISTPLVELAPRIADFKVGDVSKNWLCIALGHPSVNDDELMRLARELGLSPIQLFRSAALIGRLSIMNEVMTAYAHDDVLTMLKADDYDVFGGAVLGGHLPVMERLMEFAPTESLNMVKVNDYAAFYIAAGNGHLSIMERLMALAPGEVQNMIKADRYAAFRKAARKGHLPIMERLMELAPDEVQNMIQANYYAAFRQAARYGYLPIVERLLAIVMPEKMPYMLNATGPGPWDRATFTQNAICVAMRGNHIPVINRLLSIPEMMATAESARGNYRRYTRPFIVAKLASLRSQRDLLETSDPHAVFDISNSEEARCCFYIVRNLIRRNHLAVLEDLRFLLEIPAIKALAHLEITAGEPNELIKLALMACNQGAVGILLNITAVRELAACHDYYWSEVHGEIDLGALARDDESSMRNLSIGELERLATVVERYQPRMQETGVGHLFEDMLEELANRYQRHPAIITIEGVETALPISWDAFTHLTLTSAQHEEALKAYYQHKDHSALRYLSHPNHWMATDVSYVYINDERTQRWSTFEEYKHLIVMLWLAAQDVTISPTDGHTIEGRVTHYIDELAHIGRAHNWDHSRTRVDGSGRSIEEEYDDLTGDKPSCFSGVKRRLFQSVIGHPLLKILTEQDIQQELRDFVRGHFIRLITAENRATFQNAMTVYYGSAELSDAEPLRALNITAEQQAEFTQQLTAKYGRQFSVDPRFSRIITTAFTLVESTSNPSDSMHALKFVALANLEQLLRAPAVASAGAGGAAHGFFAGTSERDIAAAPLISSAFI